MLIASVILFSNKRNETLGLQVRISVAKAAGNSLLFPKSSRDLLTIQNLFSSHKQGAGDPMH